MAGHGSKATPGKGGCSPPHARVQRQTPPLQREMRCNVCTWLPVGGLYLVEVLDLALRGLSLVKEALALRAIHALALLVIPIQVVLVGGGDVAEEICFLLGGLVEGLLPHMLLQQSGHVTPFQDCQHGGWAQQLITEMRSFCCLLCRRGARCKMSCAAGGCLCRLESCCT